MEHARRRLCRASRSGGGGGGPSACIAYGNGALVDTIDLDCAFGAAGVGGQGSVGGDAADPLLQGDPGASGQAAALIELDL